jgi:hypothetical protein
MEEKEMKNNSLTTIMMKMNKISSNWINKSYL